MAKDTVIVGEGSHRVFFSHPQIGDLNILLGINDVQWGYRLNTVSFPTYGGEVVQILSASVDEISISGELSKRDEMMAVYSYFVRYFQIASQGRNGVGTSGKTSYNQEPMTFEYPHRGWKFQILPTSAPEFHVGRDKVVQSWSVVAHVVNFVGDGLIDAIKDSASQEVEKSIKSLDYSYGQEGDLSFFSLKGEIGYKDPSAFSDPFASDENWESTRDAVSYLKSQGMNVMNSNAEYFRGVVSAYNSGSVNDLLGSDISGPAYSEENADDPDQTVEGKAGR